MRFFAALALIALLLGGCRNEIAVEAPPRDAAQLQIPDVDSRLGLPVTIPLARIRDLIASDVPRTLYAIDESRGDCVPPERVSVLGREIRVTPRISCRIVGNVQRGNITLRGEGRNLIVRMPVTAQVSARDIGGILRGETATGSAVVEAVVRIDIDRNWSPATDITLRYNWSRAPGIDFLGQRITFMEEADERLRPVMARIERQIERELARVDVRSQAAELWQQAFTVESLNSENPPAWLWLEPKTIGITAMSAGRNALTINLAMGARTRTFLGERPEPPEAIPLPPNAPPQGAEGLDIFLPVMSEYALLEPIVLRELRQLDERGIALPGVGRVNTEIAAVEIYPTSGGRIAVGIDLAMTPTQGTARRYGKVQGRLWLTGRPRGDYDSERISIEDLQVYGDTDRLASDLLLKFAQSPQVNARIEAALQENFDREYAHVLELAQQALEEIRIGDVRLSADISQVRHGQIHAVEQGLYLPLRVNGTGRAVLVN
ncbi:DUF4403 family protein [Aurantiacibacter marinus]|uniref:DUF4403 domain-containing protein n=1 Tax=Aurantiacibacter marinus TaxID=874156 RepID=A0A0H0XLN6_9SPHN|nr:DUF4403 family protein [Aurantiacibacter marinus]KLI63503.1 hypothetical protein AAV99_06965 [Aurantiacibacter marinus]